MTVWDPGDKSRQEMLIGNHPREMVAEAMEMNQMAQGRETKSLEHRAEQKPRKPVREQEGGAEEGRRGVIVPPAPTPRRESFTKMERSTVYITTKRPDKKMLKSSHLVSHEVARDVLQV